MKLRFLTLLGIIGLSFVLAGLAMAAASTANVGASAQADLPVAEGIRNPSGPDRSLIVGSPPSPPTNPSQDLYRPYSPIPSARSAVFEQALAESHRSSARSAAMGFTSPGGMDSPAALQTGVQGTFTGDDGFVVDQVYDQAWGFVNPGETVTITRSSDGAYGSAEADGAGFFWTPLYDGSGAGFPVDLVGGDSLDFYVNGLLEKTVTVQAISGGFDVKTNLISGHVDGVAAGTPVTLTLGDYGSIPLKGAPQIVASTDAAGDFSAAFTGVNLYAANLVAAEVGQASGRVVGYLYPDPRVITVDNFSSVAGFAFPGQQVLTITVYTSYPTEIRWQDFAWPGWPHAFYAQGIPALSPGEVVEVDLGGGVLVSTTVAALQNLTYEVVADEVSGTAPSGADVWAEMWQQAGDGVRYSMVETTAGPGDQFSLDFTPVTDLQPRNGVKVFVQDANGSTSGIYGGPPYLEAILSPFDEGDCALGRVDGPGLPVTLTIQTGGEIYTRTRPIGPSGAGNEVGNPWNACYLVWGDDWGPVDFAPGSILTLQSPSLSLSLVIPEITWEVDTFADQISGAAPDGEVVVSVDQWSAGNYPLNGGDQRQATSVANAFTADFAGFDVRNGGYAQIISFDTNGYATRVGFEIPRIEAQAPYGVWGYGNYPGEQVTAALYDDAGTLLISTSVDKDPDPMNFWLDEFWPYGILPGDWITVTGDSGWETGVQVAYLTIQNNPDTDLVWGSAPKSLIWLEGSGHESGFGFFVPVDDYALNTRVLGFDLQRGDWLSARYIAPNGNQTVWSTGVGEVFRVELFMNLDGSSDMWGNALPNELVYVYTANDIFGTVSDPLSGEWNLPDRISVQPGDVITVTAGAETMPVIITVPDPFTAFAEAETGQVWGQVGGWMSQTVEVHGQWPDGYQEVQTDGDGNYLASYADMPRGGGGYIRYLDRIDFADVVFHREFRSQDLIISVNYAHDWVEGEYPAGETVWVTVTNGAGAVKGLAELQTGAVPWWGGNIGFSTNWDGWIEQPDLAPGDLVYALSSDGKSAFAQIGTIEINLDVDADLVTGTVSAGWFTSTLNGSCGVWEESGPGQNFLVEPNGGSYSCDFSAEWDLLPGHDVGIQYQEPDGDWVINVAETPVPNLAIWLGGQGIPGQGGNYELWVDYRNDGQATATNTTISLTLDAGLDYLTDTLGLPHTGTGAPGDPLIWDIGSLPVSVFTHNFRVLVSVSGVDGDLARASAQIQSPGYYQSDWGRMYTTWAEVIRSAFSEVSVDKWNRTGDPTPGSPFIWVVNVCSNGDVASTQVYLTDTLPVSTTLVRWWGVDLGWEEVSRTADEIVLTRPTVVNRRCYEVDFEFLLDQNFPLYQNLENTANVYASNDLTLTDNEDTDQVWSNTPHRNLALNKGWQSGTLVPGGEVVYSFRYDNTGNVPEENVIITQTLPAGATFIRAWHWSPGGEVEITPAVTGPGYVVWDLGTVMNGDGMDVNTVIRLDLAGAPGSEVNLQVEISRVPLEDRYDDNTIAWSDILNDLGPNLRVEKDGWARWNSSGSINYEIRVMNFGSRVLENILIVDTPPISTTCDGWWINHVEDWPSTSIACTSGQITIEIARLSSGGTASFGFNVNLDPALVDVQGLEFVNQVAAPYPGDVYPDDNDDVEVFTTGPDVFIRSDLTAGTPRPGEIVTFTVEFGNANPWPWDGDGSVGSHITLTLPAGAEFIYATAPWDPSQEWITETQSGDSLVWGWGTMWANTLWTADISFRLPDSAGGGEVLAAVFEAYGDSLTDVEYDWSNNTYIQAVTVIDPKFEVSKTYESSRVAGMPVTYNLTLTNTGNFTGTLIELIDVVPVSVNYTTGDGAYAAGTVTWNIPSLAASEQAAAWFEGTLSCEPDVQVTNSEYRVSASAEGVTTGSGAAVSFTTIAPTIQAGFTASATSINTGESVTFTSAATTDGTPLSYEWDFGDGETGTGGSSTHLFADPGTYHVVLTATDGCGFSDTFTVTITVSQIEFMIYMPVIRKP